MHTQEQLSPPSSDAPLEQPCVMSGDGHLDLYVATFKDDNHYFVGNGRGSFDRISSGVIATGGGESQHTAVGDFNGDG